MNVERTLEFTVFARIVYTDVVKAEICNTTDVSTVAYVTNGQCTKCAGDKDF